MRDWLAFPLSPTASVHTKSDEGATTDDEYAFINTESGSEQELEIAEEDMNDDEEEASTWLTVLSILGVGKKLGRKKSNTGSKSTSSSSSLNTTTTPIISSEVAAAEETEYKENKSEYLETTTTTSRSDSECEEDEGIHLFQASMGKSLAESVASSIDSDTSTPANSQIHDLNLTAPSKCLKEYLPTAKTVKICWNHGGKKVQITGEFDNWTTPIDMTPDKEGGSKYHIDLPLTLDKDIEFKFVVDGEWRYADDLPHRTDINGNINNVLFKETITASLS